MIVEKAVIYRIHSECNKVIVSIWYLFIFLLTKIPGSKYVYLTWKKYWNVCKYVPYIFVYICWLRLLISHIKIVCPRVLLPHTILTIIQPVYIYTLLELRWGRLNSQTLSLKTLQIFLQVKHADHEIRLTFLV